VAAIHLVSQQSDTRRARTKQNKQASNKQASAKMHGVFGWFLEWFLEWFPDRFPDGFKETKKSRTFQRRYLKPASLAQIIEPLISRQANNYLVCWCRHVKVSGNLAFINDLVNGFVNCFCQWFLLLVEYQLAVSSNKLAANQLHLHTHSKPVVFASR